MIPFSELADDCCLFFNLRTKLDLPDNRETVLHFFEAVRKSCPTLTELTHREDGQYSLEEDPRMGGGRFISLEERRLGGCFVKPDELGEATAQHRRVLEIAPCHLGISDLDCELLEVGLSFDFDYAGNHDALIAEALTAGSALGAIGRPEDSRLLFFQPSMTFVLDDSCRLQWTLAIQTRSDAFQLRTGQFPELPISVFVTVARYWDGRPAEKLAEEYARLSGKAVSLVENVVGPEVMAPLARAIEARR